MLTQTGKSLADLRSFDLFDAGYRLMVARSLLTEDEVKVVDQIDSRLADSGYEKSTGLPAITQWLPPANIDEIDAQQVGTLGE